MGNAHGHHGDQTNHGNRKHSGGAYIPSEGLTFGDKNHANREMSPFDPIGPVDITKNEPESKKSTPTKAHRPRSTTESGPRRHISIDYPQKIDENEFKNAINKQIGVVNSEGGSQRKLPTIIKYSGQGKEVFVCGSFNGWQKMRMSRSQKDFVAMVELGEGDHEYKFLVDGQWFTDPNASIVENNAGYKNNVIHVQKGDFDAFEALDMDMETVNKAQSHKNAKVIKPQTCYGQEMPQSISTSGTEPRGQPGPPILPPHLLQVILNKDTPMSCEPTLLPEPNHVMLNHLYALSIKDGVMVLSTTQRYKKKYVTTLLYKPMGHRTPDE